MLKKGLQNSRLVTLWVIIPNDCSRNVLLVAGKPGDEGEGSNPFNSTFATKKIIANQDAKQQSLIYGATSGTRLLACTQNGRVRLPLAPLAHKSKGLKHTKEIAGSSPI